MKPYLYSILTLLISFFMINNVNAESIFYENKNAVKFSECEYNFISNLVGEGIQKNMTEEEFNTIFYNIECSANIVTETYNDSKNLRGATHTTQNKSLSISKACTTNNCVISTTLNWINLPIVRSYDVIGAYLYNTNLTNSNIVTYVNGVSSNEIKMDTNGFGVSLKLPTSAEKINIAQIFNISNSGTVYASYQHAVKSISLSNSKKYSISRTGYGGVILFQNSIQPYYDGMGGVNISM